MHLVAFVCVCVYVYGVTKKCLYTLIYQSYVKDAYCTLIHFMSPEMFARSIELYREQYILHVSFLIDTLGSLGSSETL